MAKHIIQNYDQVKLRLEQLSKDYNKRSRDYKFAIGDLFNQNIPAGIGSPEFTGETLGLSGWQYQQRLGNEIDRLLEETGTDLRRGSLSVIRTTARAWKKTEREYDVAFGVYRALLAHKELIYDGMTTTVAEAAVTALASSTKRPVRVRSVNRTQRLVATVNQLRGQLKALDKDDGSPLTPEEIERIGEAYAALDSYCERKGVSMYDELAVA